MLLQGLIDLNKEITKLENKKKRLVDQLDKLHNSIKVPDYETKVRTCYFSCFFYELHSFISWLCVQIPESVRKQNADKVKFLTLHFKICEIFLISADFVCFLKITQVEKELENIKKALGNLKLS